MNDERLRERHRNRLLKKIIKDDNGCWIYQGKYDKDGYGLYVYKHPSFAQTAHRASFIAFVKDIPKGRLVLHHCDVKNCINPQHLYLGSAKQNVKDALERGQFPRGPNPKKAKRKEENGRAILNMEMVRRIRKEYIPYKVSLNNLSNKYRVSKRQILRIIKKESWKYD